MSARLRSGDVTIGYAVDGRGLGMAYARLETGGVTAVVRVPFCARAHGPDLPPDVIEELHALDAVTTVVAYVRGRGFYRVSIAVDNAAVVEILNGHRTAAAACEVAYVQTRCALRRLAAARVHLAKPAAVHDLRARARVEIELRTA